MIVVVVEMEGVAMMVEVEGTVFSEVFSAVLVWLGLVSIWQQTRSP